MEGIRIDVSLCLTIFLCPGSALQHQDPPIRLVCPTPPGRSSHLAMDGSVDVPCIWKRPTCLHVSSEVFGVVVKMDDSPCVVELVPPLRSSIARQPTYSPPPLVDSPPPLAS
nr:hypothetical protein Iba_chr03dCG2470 [Ipomoea batatas]